MNLYNLFKKELDDANKFDVKNKVKDIKKSFESLKNVIKEKFDTYKSLSHMKFYLFEIKHESEKLKENIINLELDVKEIKKEVSSFGKISSSEFHNFEERKVKQKILNSPFFKKAKFISLKANLIVKETEKINKFLKSAPILLSFKPLKNIIHTINDYSNKIQNAAKDIQNLFAKNSQNINDLLNKLDTALTLLYTTNDLIKNINKSSNNSISILYGFALTYLKILKCSKRDLKTDANINVDIPDILDNISIDDENCNKRLKALALNVQDAIIENELLNCFGIRRMSDILKYAEEKFDVDISENVSVLIAKYNTLKTKFDKINEKLCKTIAKIKSSKSLPKILKYLGYENSKEKFNNAIKKLEKLQKTADVLNSIESEALDGFKNFINKNYGAALNIDFSNTKNINKKPPVIKLDKNIALIFKKEKLFGDK